MREILEADVWAEHQFGACDLKDKRRTRRLVKFASQICGNPSGNTPMQTSTWSDCKAAYRLIDQESATFQSITAPHYARTRRETSKVCLLLNDTTEIDLGYDSPVEGLSSVGNGSCGFLLHNSLMVECDGEVIGLAGQRIHHRQVTPKNEKRMQRFKRNRESLLWGDLIAQVGRPPEGVQWIDVCDRGADDFELYVKMLQHGHDWVVRAHHLQRCVMGDAQHDLPLCQKVQQLPVYSTQYTLTYRNKEKEARTATMEVRSGTIGMKAPKIRSPWLRDQDIALLTMHVVDAREVNAAPGVKPLHWILLTSLPVVSFDDAWRVIEHYEKRWMIEEFHKALKTGCRVEERQYRTSDRLETITGLLSVVAVRLLQLRSVAKHSPNQPVTKAIPQIWITALKILRPRATIGTLKDFFRQLAGLGGHLLRNSDGDPGWITIWRGYNQLHLAIKTLRGYNKKCG